MSFDQKIQRLLCLILSPISGRAGGAHVWSRHHCVLCAKTKTETQKSVHEWCKDTFPRHVGKKGRAIALIEEAAELGLAAGLNFETIRRAVDVPIMKHIARSGAGVPMESDAGEVADVLLCAYAYAEEAGIDSHKELNDKMRENRSRPAEYYTKKTAQKEDMGFILEDAPPRQ